MNSACNAAAGVAKSVWDQGELQLVTEINVEVGTQLSTRREVATVSAHVMERGAGRSRAGGESGEGDNAQCHRRRHTKRGPSFTQASTKADT